MVIYLFLLVSLVWLWAGLHMGYRHLWMLILYVIFNCLLVRLAPPPTPISFGASSASRLQRRLWQCRLWQCRLWQCRLYAVPNAVPTALWNPFELLGFSSVK